MVNTGLLVLTNPVRIKNLLSRIKGHVLKTLYIQYLPEEKNVVFVYGNHESPQLPQYKSSFNNFQLVANIYALASSVSTRLDVRILLPIFKGQRATPSTASHSRVSSSVIRTTKPVEMVIFDKKYDKNEAQTFIRDCLANASMGCEFLSLEASERTRNDDESSCSGSFRETLVSLPAAQQASSVVLGGTFDRLHNGHKILLSKAVLLGPRKLVVGVTVTDMLKSKSLWELIEPCSTRISRVKDFLEDIEPSVIYDVVAIDDLYGPTKSDPDMDAIVVSEETIRGAEKINELRGEKGLKKLEIHIVKLAEDGNRGGEHEELKISSSNQRLRLLGTRLKNPKPNDDSVPARPYIIGLTGGIASGKSSVASKLENLGAGLVNCDVIAHNLYEPEERCYNMIVEHFGKAILTTPDGLIDRKALGHLVFNDKNQLKKLNNLVWPIILEEAKKQIRELHAKGFDIIIMEAAVMIQAHWQCYCHEIWTCIVPEKEAISRLIERNGITEEEAKMRISAQPSNMEQVIEANVVLSTMWSYKVTEEQVQKAWNQLLAYLEARQER